MFSIMFHFMEKVGDASQAIYDGRREERLRDYEEHLRWFPGLITREFKANKLTNNDNATVSDFEVESQIYTEPQQLSVPFRVFQWNILADGRLCKCFVDLYW